MLKHLFKHLLVVLLIISAMTMVLEGCSSGKTIEKDPHKLTYAAIQEALEEGMDELPEVQLVNQTFTILPAKDTLDHEKIICDIYVSKKDPQVHSFTDYTDKLIRMRVISKVKEKLREEKIVIEPYFNIIFLSRG
ncbi:MAG: hypothetical protein ACK4ND_16615 [Cytophagaceae bacterium]